MDGSRSRRNLLQQVGAMSLAAASDKVGSASPDRETKLSESLNITVHRVRAEAALSVVSNDEAKVEASAFSNAALFVLNRNNGSGNRECVHAEVQCRGGRTNEQLVGVIGYTNLITGSGTAYGGNFVVKVDQACAADAQAIAVEVDVEAKRDVVSKIGIQTIDIGDSNGRGIVNDAAYLVGQQHGARGFENGLMFGLNGTDSFGIAPGGALINTCRTTIPLRVAIDVSGVSACREGTVKMPTGGSIFSDDGGSLSFRDHHISMDFGSAPSQTFSREGIDAGGHIRTTPVKVRDLPRPTREQAGMRMCVIDALDPGFRKPVRGDGDEFSPVIWTGSKWLFA